MRRLLAVGLWALSAVIGGCGDDSTTGSGSGGSAAGGGGAGGGGGSGELACTGQPETLSLGGTWAARGRLAISVTGKPGGSIVTCPDDQIGEATLLVLLDMQEDPADPKKLSSVKATLCSIELPTVTALVGTCDETADNLVTTQLIAPKELIDALPMVASESVTGTLADTKPGAALTLDRFVVNVGTGESGASMPTWDTTNPACDMTDVGWQMTCSDTCVSDCVALRDDDGDGYPGVTLEVCGSTPDDMSKGLMCNASDPSNPGVTVQGRAFLDIQVDPQFTGDASSSCEIRGNVDTSVLYNLIGAEVYLVGSAIGVTTAIESLPDFTVLPDDSAFRMIRIDGKYATDDWNADPTNPSAACAAVIAHANDL